ncbi:hypothetical protein CCACVL1_00750 [Corchorus capsularis]|uniref:Uncharacterized protein n=1 Tax=Corchorus capsularis TaxID=210143 RepID=A0A1R3KUX4_COCAP|nr:hypothetical protein CCACVL1_00750 [Corchorus capsularis]
MDICLAPHTPYTEAIDAREEDMKKKKKKD